MTFRFLLVAALATTLLTACHPEETATKSEDVTIPATSGDDYLDTSSGLAMNPMNGRIGIDLGGGLMIDSGGNVGIGIGF